MQDKDPNAPQEASLPFFTRFLEGQNNTELSAATHKYPSDWDEIVTHKYPSDDDEGGDDSVYGSVLEARVEINQSRQTLKYPSDRDEGDVG